MSLEEVIKQTRPFKSPFEKALVNIMYTYGVVVDQQKQFFKQFDITPKQYNILRILRGAKKPMTTSQIRERMLDKMSDTTRIVNRMITKGWVQKEVNDVDRRLVDIAISDKGIALLKQVEQHSESIDKILQNLSDDDVRQLNALLDKIREVPRQD